MPGSNSRYTKTQVVARHPQIMGGEPSKIAALCEDGRIRVVRVGYADSYWTAPAHVKIGGKSRKGHVTWTFGENNETIYKFIMDPESRQ